MCPVHSERIRSCKIHLTIGIITKYVHKRTVVQLNVASLSFIVWGTISFELTSTIMHFKKKDAVSQKRTYYLNHMFSPFPPIQ